MAIAESAPFLPWKSDARAHCRLVMGMSEGQSIAALRDAWATCERFIPVFRVDAECRLAVFGAVLHLDRVRGARVRGES